MHPTLVDGLANFHYPTATIPQTLKQSANLSRFASDKDNLAMKLAKPYFSKTSGLLSSNLGKLNIPTNYGDLTLDRAMLIPMMKHKIPLYMTGVTFNGRLVFGLSYVIKPNEKNSAKTETMIQIRNLALKILGFPDKESSFRMS